MTHSLVVSQTNMAGIESGPEILRIILIDNTNNVTEVTAPNVVGARMLNAVGASLLAAAEGSLLTATQLVIEKPEKDTPTSEEIILASQAPTWTSPERTLELVTAEYKKKPDDHSLLAEFNQQFWNESRERMGLSRADLVVKDCPYSDDDIRKFMGLGRSFRKSARLNDFGLYVPEVISTAPDGLVLLGKGYPLLGSWAFEAGTSARNVDKDEKGILLFGWMRTEKDINAPYLGTNQAQAEEAVKKAHRIGDTLNVYAAAGEQSKLLFDQYPDEVRIWVRILSSRFAGQVLLALFNRDGYCYVRWGLGSGLVYDALGVRSVEV